MRGVECRLVVAVLLNSFLLVAGCAKDGLNQVLREYNFTPISPPQSDWRVGSIVEIDPKFETAPVLFQSPTAQLVAPALVQRNAPDVSRDHDEKIELGGGVSLPAEFTAQLAAQGVRQYSVVASGNQIEAVAIDTYAAQVFPAMAPDPVPAHWAAALGEDRLRYLYETWMATQLDFKFYDERGVSLTFAAPPALPTQWNAAASFKWTDKGTLTYSNSARPLCLGYRARWIRQAEGGEPVPQAAGQLTAANRDARAR